MYDRYFRPLFFSQRFYVTLVGIIFIFVLSYNFTWLFVIAQLVLLVFVVLVILDYVILFFRKQGIKLPNAKCVTVSVMGMIIK